MIKIERQKYQNIFENSVVGMFRSKIDGTKVFAISQPLCDLFGYTQKEMLSNPVTLIWADPKDLERLVNQLLRDGIIRNNEVNFISKSGEFKNCLLFLKLYPEEGHIEGCVIDITEENQSKKQLFTTLESIGDGFFAYDADWRFIYVNAQAERLLGMSRFELLGKNRWELFPETIGTTVETEFRKAAAGEIREFENFNEPWGRWFNVRCYPHLGGGLSVYFVDITESKQAAIELKQYHERLEDIVNTRTIELSKAYEQLKLENDIRKTTEVELERRSKELEEMNTALKVILKQREEDKNNVEMNVITNHKVSILPYLELLERTKLNDDQKTLLSIIKSNLDVITSTFNRKISAEYRGLSVNEIKIASLIREGKTSKEISELLNISIATVSSYRRRIRAKTGLKNENVNLQSYLKSLE
jgi:PAS domain S-box-containing protein